MVCGCFWNTAGFEYLGHVISGCGVAVDPAKVKSIWEWPVSHEVRGVRGFLGLTSYYRKIFIRIQMQ